MISQQTEICLALHNIRSCHNVGSIFRTADAVGVKKIFITGVTPAPIDRFGRQRKDISKVALRAEKSVKWEYVKDIENLIADMKKKEFQICALEQDKRSVDYREAKMEKKVLLILGEEVNGVPKEILDKCDQIIEIPMRGEKESLNVSVATGIVLFEIFPC